jgi:hypothetical protein
VSRGLALRGVYFIDVYIGSETTPGSSGAVPDTLTPGWRGKKTLAAAHTGEYSFIPFMDKLGRC